MYDVDRDGYISNGELYLVLKMMVGNNLKVRPHLSGGRKQWLKKPSFLFCRTSNCSRLSTRVRLLPPRSS